MIAGVRIVRIGGRAALPVPPGRSMSWRRWARRTLRAAGSRTKAMTATSESAEEAAPTEKIYFVLSGEVTVISATERIVLKAWDSIHIGAGEGREIINETNMPASMLVVINYPDA